MSYPTAGQKSVVDERLKAEEITFLEAVRELCSELTPEEAADELEKLEILDRMGFCDAAYNDTWTTALKEKIR